MTRPAAAALLAASLVVAGCASRPSQPTVVKAVDEAGIPVWYVNGALLELTDEERRNIANALIKEYAPTYCD